MFKDAKDYDIKLQRNYGKKFEGKFYTEWAQELEVSLNVIHKRMNHHGTPFYNNDRNFKGVANGYGVKPKLISYDGKTATEWANELGIASSTIRKRLAQYGHPYGKRVCKKMGLKLK